MENLHEEQRVVDLLRKLKDSSGGGSYPSDMLAARRRTYMRQMANVGLGIGLGVGLKNMAKGGSNGASGASAATSKVLEIVLIAAIAIEASTAAFLYRDKILDAIRSSGNGPTAPVASVPSLEEASSSAPAVIEILPTIMPTLSGTPSGTPSSTPGTSTTSVAGGNNQNSNDPTNNTSVGANTGINANATPHPNNGNQYGLTPKPERTKENSGGGGGNGGGSDTGGGNNGGGGGNGGQ
jgi:hypothetical protein